MRTPRRRSPTGAQVELLFQCKYGPVCAYIRGPRSGFRWRNIEYCRWQMSTKQSGAWDKLHTFRSQDQPHLKRCAAAVSQWLRDND